jgi:hypothetical protein
MQQNLQQGNEAKSAVRHETAPAITAILKSLFYYLCFICIVLSSIAFLSAVLLLVTSCQV